MEWNGIAMVSDDRQSQGYTTKPVGTVTGGGLLLDLDPLTRRLCKKAVPMPVVPLKEDWGSSSRLSALPAPIGSPYEGRSQDSFGRRECRANGLA